MVKRSSTLHFRASSIVLLSQAPRQRALGDCSHRAQSHSSPAYHPKAQTGLSLQGYHSTTPAWNLCTFLLLQTHHYPAYGCSRLNCLPKSEGLQHKAAMHSMCQVSAWFHPKNIPPMCPVFPANHPHDVTPALEFQFYAVFENTFQ